MGAQTRRIDEDNGPPSVHQERREAIAFCREQVYLIQFPGYNKIGFCNTESTRSAQYCSARAGKSERPSQIKLTENAFCKNIPVPRLCWCCSAAISKSWRELPEQTIDHRGCSPGSKGTASSMTSRYVKKTRAQDMLIGKCCQKPQHRRIHHLRPS